MKAKSRSRAARRQCGGHHSQVWMAPPLSRGMVEARNPAGGGRETLVLGRPGTDDQAVGAEGEPGGLRSTFRVGSQEIHRGDVVTVYTLGLGPGSPGFTGVVLKSTPAYLHLGLFAHDGESASGRRPIVAEAIIRCDQIACVVRRIPR
ncbi:hypothetical protein [Alicyclobacillus sendaiensis]|uniref:hypothetical protein n=1 Tax=Alicyclobacillus sendaiensis TaxID=192387 RepID=UPI0026F435C6|nr:hypothetical protein [Alicyclobacillus sendaiensis]